MVRWKSCIQEINRTINQQTVHSFLNSKDYSDFLYDLSQQRKVLKTLHIVLLSQKQKNWGKLNQWFICGISKLIAQTIIVDGLQSRN